MGIHPSIPVRRTLDSAEKICCFDSTAGVIRKHKPVHRRPASLAYFFGPVKGAGIARQPTGTAGDQPA